MVEDEGQDVGVRRVIPGAPESSEPGAQALHEREGPGCRSRAQWSLRLWGLLQRWLGLPRRR